MAVLYGSHRCEKTETSMVPPAFMSIGKTSIVIGIELALKICAMNLCTRSSVLSRICLHSLPS